MNKDSCLNTTERAAHPSRVQVAALLDFLEKNPGLTNRFTKKPSARDGARKLWKRQAHNLNCLGGSIKTWKQWAKYWADKKSLVKKKAAQHFRTRNQTADGAETVDSSIVEKRIVSLMGGERIFNVAQPAEVIRPKQPSPQHTQPSLSKSDSASLLATPRIATSSQRRRCIPTQRHTGFTQMTERLLRIEEKRVEIDNRNSLLLEKLVNRELQRDCLAIKALASIGEGLVMVAEALRI